MMDHSENDCDESISMHDFLDFLKITCQVNDSFNSSKKNAPPFDYNQLAKNELVNNINAKTGVTTENTNVPGSSPTKQGVKKDVKDDVALKKTYKKKSLSHTKSQKSKPETFGPPKKNLDALLNEKLDEVLNEGILDSVLPFICPVNALSTNSYNKSIIAKSSANPVVQITTGTGGSKSANSGIETSSPEVQSGSGIKKTNLSAVGDVSQCFLIASSTSKTGARRKTSISQMTILDSRSEPEVIIHVCDEVKGTSRDFSCPQKLLISKMGYFADVTAGQRLEDMDISVHCDLQIFEWLMKWVKKDSISQDEWPVLDPTNVVPILVSASFLQMEPLLLDCLSFCHARLNEVVKASANLACLNDSIITRLAAMFTNLELEMVKDKKDRIAPRLWTKMIQSLCEIEPQALRGHYATLIGMFRCLRCGKFLTQTVSTFIHCVPQNIRLNRWGQLISSHVKDSSWNITSYVASLHKELRSWRKVYWRLWGHCHFLYCAICDTHFAVCQMLWCQYHPEQPQFLGPAAEGRVTGPAGRYPCCGKQAYRYETLPGPTGCQFREHTVQADTDRDRAIHHLAMQAAEGGCLYETAPFKPSNTASDPWWNGIGILPHRSRQGLLPMFHVDGDVHASRVNRKTITRQLSLSVAESDTETESEDGEKSGTILSHTSSSSSDGGESEYSSPRSFRPKSVKHKPKISYGRHWAGEMSARSNQDNQREFEERAMKQIIAMVGKKTGGEQNQQYTTYQQGGTYIRLEADWRESFKQKNLASIKAKPGGVK
ncbi:SANT and BTB domain regulator of class switch recombination [Toxorhynchites rutilus septentrionalis]|uniref:SANT and BTB domain regulator of class switch recombination n=1 Tax=Toxorhynchites rutilus septentrionalis TaxID=329112 RepID=UPI00247A7969|nr:SANT and BTB domain regulator of class switch recombination [Toxorhynchites rutilus septentrionalis]